MKEVALKLLKEIEDYGYKAYIVGGFVRDYLLGIESKDIDITTDATPMELKEIFEDSLLPNEDYGSVIVFKNNIRFEITTFRMEINYSDNRHPMEVKYIDDLYQDLLRRDFTINTICMDSNGEIIDLLHGRDDLDNRIIITVGDSDLKLSQDALRILRAIRFATILDFNLDSCVVNSIHNNKHLLKTLSYNRKKEELEKIFVSSNAKKGISLLLDFGLDVELELNNLDKVTSTDSLIGIWSVLDVGDIYPFTSNEKELITKIREAFKYNNLDPYVLYKYDLYVNSVAGDIKGIDKKDITKAYNELVIKSKSDLDITSQDIMDVLNREPGEYLKDIYDDIIIEILYKRLENKKEKIVSYILSKYS